MFKCLSVFLLRLKNLFGEVEVSIQSGAPFNVQLVNITPIAMVDGTYNEVVTGVYRPTYNVWGTHIVAYKILEAIDLTRMSWGQDESYMV